jgi:hypothetical protein
MVGDARRMIIVTDSQVSDEDSHTKSLDNKKVYEIPHGYLGGAGDVGSIEKVVEWFKNGKKDKDKPEISSDNDADFILLNAEGMFMSGKDLEFWRVRSYDAIGSGQSAALGAMILGHSAEEAVWASTKVDLYSGGDIVIYSLEKKPTTYHKKG